MPTDPSIECQKLVKANLTEIEKYNANSKLIDAYNLKLAVYAPLKTVFDTAVLAEKTALTAYQEWTDCTWPAYSGTRTCETLHGTTNLWRTTSYPQNVSNDYDCSGLTMHTQCFYSDTGIETLMNEYKAGTRAGMDGKNCPKEPVALETKPAIYKLKMADVTCCNQQFDNNKFGPNDVVNFKNITQTCQHSLDAKPPPNPIPHSKSPHTQPPEDSSDPTDPTDTTGSTDPTDTTGSTGPTDPPAGPAPTALKPGDTTAYYVAGGVVGALLLVGIMYYVQTRRRKARALHR